MNSISYDNVPSYEEARRLYDARVAHANQAAAEVEVLASVMTLNRDSILRLSEKFMSLRLSECDPHERQYSDPVKLMRVMSERPVRAIYLYPTPENCIVEIRTSFSKRLVGGRLVTSFNELDDVLTRISDPRFQDITDLRDLTAGLDPVFLERHNPFKSERALLKV